MTLYPTNVQELFALGMKRSLRDIREPTGPFTLELGPGNSPMGCAYELSLPMHDIGEEAFPLSAASVDAVYAFHVFEHLTPDGVVHCLRECARVMKGMTPLSICVPYYRSNLAFRDLDHKSFYTERTWDQLLKNDYYDNMFELRDLFDIGFNAIIGVEEANLALLTQLIRLP